MKRRLSSLDQHYACEADVFEPDRYRQVLSLGDKDKLAVQGGGVSYTALSFGGDSRVVNMSRFNRLLGFDPETLTLEAEAGITLGKLFRFLVPRGFVMSIQPGHPQITLGGCIAANVHGKNQYREGIFSEITQEVRLFHPAHGEMTLSRTSEPELFDLTCGGMGLTGIILSAKINISRLRGNCIEVSHIPVNNVSETFSLMDEEKNRRDIMYSWNDLARFDNAMGRGYLISGKFVTYDSPPSAPPSAPLLDPHKRRRLALPLLNRRSLPVINALYYRATCRTDPCAQDFFSSFFPMWNKRYYFFSYGRGGFIEFQILVPDAAKYDYLKDFEDVLRRHRQPFGLASFKLFKGRQRLLHYNGSGISFSLHIANNRYSLVMLEELDQLNIRYGVITNLIKDSRISAGIVRRQYPEFDEFVTRLRAFDPKRTWITAFSKRFGI